MPSNDYWEKRAVDRLKEAEKQTDEYIKRIKKMYTRANCNIKHELDRIYKNYSKTTGIDVQTLKTLLSKSETIKFWKTMEGKGLKQYVQSNYKARINRLEQIQGQLYAKAKEIYGDEFKYNYGVYKSVINRGYLRTIYDTQIGTGYDFTFNKLDENSMNVLLNARWSGKNYSERIWTNTNLLADKVSELVGGALLSGQAISKTAYQISKAFGVASYYAERLVRTEANHFHNEAEALAYEELGVKKYVFIAVLDGRTSETCQKLDNKVFKMSDRTPGVNCPPMHPNCRSTFRAYLGAEEEKRLKRRARDPITGKTEIINNMSYKEWTKKNDISTKSSVEGLT